MAVIALVHDVRRFAVLDHPLLALESAAVQARRIGRLVTPGVNPLTRAARGKLPLGFRGQARSALRQPAARDTAVVVRHTPIDAINRVLLSLGLLRIAQLAELFALGRLHAWKIHVAQGSQTIAGTRTPFIRFGRGLQLVEAKGGDR